MKLLISFLLLSSTLLAQNNIIHSLPDRIYNRLERYNLLLDSSESYFEFPLSKFEIYNSLNGFSQRDYATNLDKDNILFFNKELNSEFNSGVYLPGELNYFYSSENIAFTFFSSNSDNISFYLNPILETSYYSRYVEQFQSVGSGLELWGSIGENFGYSFRYIDNTEDSPDRIKKRYFSPETGRHLVAGGYFSEVQTTLSYSWNWGTVSLNKNFIELGSGEGGKIILSDKAPSSPYLKLDLEPADWIKFTYLHGWLNSGIRDEYTIHLSAVDSGSTFRDIFESVDKYIALHYVTFKPVNNLYLTLGESIIYSRELKPIFLMPLMFFRLADHYNSDGDRGDNSQFFGEISYLWNKINTRFYYSFFIDELDLSKIFDEGDRHWAFTIGSKSADLFIDNSMIVFEYTRLEPFVYNNGDPAETYQSSGYDLGHWMGQNSEQLYFRFDKGIYRGLDASLEARLITKGENGSLYDQYNNNYPGFLFGEQKKISSLGFTVYYEWINNFLLKINYSYENIEGEDRNNLPPSGTYNNFYFTFRFGY